jgi:outer membrane protein W
MVGYAWLARWLIGGGFKVGLGYTVAVTARADANYVPFPAVLPLASLGSDRLSFYTVWVPTTEVLFFFARISLPFKESAPVPNGEAGAWPLGPAAGGRFRANLLYGAIARVDPDASGIDSAIAGHSSAPLAGYRHFVSDTLAFDLSVTRSDHWLDLSGARLGTFDMIPVSLTAQYHLPSHRGLRMYAGAGVSYTWLTNQDLPGYSLSGGSVSPVLQAGAAYPLTDALVLNGGLSVNFARHRLTQDGTTLGTVKLSPVTFSLGLGYAF